MSFSLPAPQVAQDQTAIIRDAVVASLIAYGIAAAGVFCPVEAERVDPVEDGDMPRIIVFADTSATSVNEGNTAPVFDATTTIIVQCLAQRALNADSVADIDALVAQVKDCLFGDPSWVQEAGKLLSYRVSRSMKFEGHRVLGDARVMIETRLRERYPPRVVTRLITVTETTTPPAGTQAIEFGVTLPSS